MIPKIDSDIGILHYTTKFAGVGGRIRARFEDFAVSEVLSEKTLASLSEDDGFAVYLLKKSGIDTNHALERISQRFGARLKALGLKDSSAVTEQYVCSMARGRAVPKYVDDKISLEKIGFSKKPLSAKDMRGNHFTIIVTGATSDISNFAEQDCVLNFYGYQRFGSKRPVTHLVGKALLRRQFADAVRLFLSFSSEYDSDENTKLRNMMQDPSRYSEALQSIPRQMDLERTLLSEMIEHSDPQKAILKLPLSIRRLFVDAYQSYLFNLVLSKSYEYGEDLFAPKQDDVCYDKAGTVRKYEMDPDQHLAIPLVGYSYFKKTRFDYHISEVLKQEEISHKDFYFKEMQELSTEGGFRTSSLVCGDFSAKGDTVSFTLQRGSFATILMREIMKPQSPLEAGF
ncbi:tRNA pseudouridine(13) synthase TruD [Candidatus Nitrosotenuis cloacae]|uniref:tRNA pseudouridine(13) synthase TruD n=1 Tax=Candidatus Nitrosotenuis cloacae TaxID=1603555 RepID=UPI00227E9FED|nr:tRNA pseudouridine(13) synthase TruD [Candidatus Nitrosotenuis cloacae]